MVLLEPGADFSDHDNWNEHPLGKDAPKHRLGQDGQLMNGDDD
jgi:hypothetical protein